MLQLIYGQLLPSDDARLRGQLARDSRLAERLAAVRACAKPPTDLSDAISEADADQIAAWLDQGLSESDADAFERRCWESPALLREVYAAWSALETESSPALTSLVKALRTEPVYEPGMSGVRPRQSTSRVSAAAALLVLLVMLLIWFRRSPAEHSMADGRPPVPEPKAVEKSLLPEAPSMMSDSTPLVEMKRSDAITEPMRPQPAGTSNSDIADIRPQPVPPSQEMTRPSDSSMPETVEPKKSEVALLKNVKVTSGVAALTDGSDGWAGVESDAGRDLIQSGRVRLMTFVDSYVSGDLTRGTLVLGPESQTILEMPEADEEIRLKLESGTAVLRELPRGLRMTLECLSGAAAIVCLSQDCQLGLVRDDAGCRVAVLRGSVEIGDVVLTRRGQAMLTEDGVVTPLREATAISDWTMAARRTPIPTGLHRVLNSANDIALAAERTLAEGAPESQFHAVEVLLQCAATESDDQLIQRAAQYAASDQERQRQAVIAWLLRMLRGHSSGRRRLASVLGATELDAEQQNQVASWFQAIAEQRRPDAAMMTELMGALRGGQPRFGKQCAREFLSLLLQDPLTEYRVDSVDNSAALQSITRKLRLWQTRPNR
ncbi:MAG: hypothetical protein ACK58L_05665 [Planctomycetota bacterium]